MVIQAKRVARSVLGICALFVLVYVLVLAFTRCNWDSPPQVDEAAMEKYVLQYMEETYHVSFEIIGKIDDHPEGWGYEDDYYTADIKLQNSETDERYVVTIKPNWTDENNDGFCDSYTVTNENYLTIHSQ